MDATQPRRLNLGCGFDKRDGFVNADKFDACAPDVRVDLEVQPWPFDDNAFDHILLKHVLEHVGATVEGFFAVMRELYRVTAPGGIIEIHVPHYKHDSYWSDPTHVRAFTALTFQMMSKANNDRWIAGGENYTMLAYAMGVDFELVEGRGVYDAYWLAKLQSGEMTSEELFRASEDRWGVIREIVVKLKAVKPA